MQASPESTEQSDGPDNESDHIQFGIMATTNLLLKSTVSKTWILLDKNSTVDVFPTPCWSGISSWQIIHYASADGTAYTNYIADFPGYVTIWFLHNGFTNILSLQQMKQFIR